MTLLHAMEFCKSCTSGGVCYLSQPWEQFLVNCTTTGSRVTTRHFGMYTKSLKTVVLGNTEMLALEYNVKVW